MSNSARDDIAIIGGGIAGLALARALRLHGRDCSLIERCPVAIDGGLAVNLPGNAIQALAALGLGDAIRSLGYPLLRREYRTARDKLLFEIDEDAFWGDALRPRSIRRSTLMTMLGEKVGCDVYHDTATSIAIHQDCVGLELASGSKLAAGILVGADGVRSQVREAAFSGVAGREFATLAQASWRFMAPNPGIEYWTVWAGADGMILLMPVGDEVYGWAAVTRGNSVGGGRDELNRLSEAFPGRVRRAVDTALARPDMLYHSPLEEVRTGRWATHRAVLIGDAAHATAPIWAQGVALALEDAIVLAKCIAANTEMTEAANDYELRRRPRVAHVQAMTDAMTRAAKLPSVVRNALMPIIGPKRYRETYEPLKNLI